MRRGTWTTGLLAAMLALLCAASAQANQVVDVSIPDRNHEIPNQWLHYYPNGGPPHAMVILPDHYDPAKAYPLLLLLPGLDNTYKTWTNKDQGDAGDILKGFDAITVTPEGGDGWYTDWWNDGKRGDPAWESYILDEVLPFILDHYRIRPERRWHALAGTSMGGLGAAYLGGRLPGYFGSVAIMSGLVDLETYYGQPFAMSTLSTANGGMAPTNPEAVDGPNGGFYENGHNPVKLAFNYGETRVYMTTGDGTAAPDSTTGQEGAVGTVEEGEIIHPAMEHLAAAFRAAGVDYVYHSHSGYHDWPNFHRELREIVAWRLFAPVDEHPTSWVNDTVATHGKLWEFAYKFDSPPDQVVRFRRNGDALSVSAAGSPVTITTDGGCSFHLATPAELAVPPRPCNRLALRVSPRRIRAGRRARVRITVTPAVVGTAVRLGSRTATTDAAGVARFRLCLSSRGRRRVRAELENHLPASAVVRARGRGRCASVKKR
jgi:S-formylglutathione hydrolase FrmB